MPRISHNASLDTLHTREQHCLSFSVQVFGQILGQFVHIFLFEHPFVIGEFLSTPLLRLRPEPRLMFAEHFTQILVSQFLRSRLLPEGFDDLHFERGGGSVGVVRRRRRQGARVLIGMVSLGVIGEKRRTVFG